jgi:hypothetical protein
MLLTLPWQIFTVVNRCNIASFVDDMVVPGHQDVVFGCGSRAKEETQSYSLPVDSQALEIS